MRLFISYARVDKTYCMEIIETLEIHEIWYDQRLYAGQHWWQEILRRLNWCQGFVYIISSESLASEYCRKEFEIAQKRGKHLFPVLIEGTRIPPEFKDIQCADMRHGLTLDAVRSLLNAVAMADRQSPPLPEPATPPASTSSDTPVSISSPTIIGKAAHAMQNGKYDRAVFLLKQAQSIGYKSRFINLDTLLIEAELALERQVYIREAQREYKPITELINHESTRRYGRDAFEQFRHDFPDYDPENLAGICDGSISIPSHNNSKAPGRVVPHQPGLTSLEWCKIPGALVKITNNVTHQQKIVEVSDFYISKYPITNAVFQIFAEDPDGYSNPGWWDFSFFARDWRTQNPEPKQAGFSSVERPRENVTWYEAMAFCNWLSERLNRRITLPSNQQWQRAAQGDDSRYYPWGNTFDPGKCNTLESQIKMSTLVMRYNEGVSPFGVYDMAGNVWEWCLNSEDEDEESCDISTSESRIIRGGSFMTRYSRAQNNLYFNINPEYFYSSIGFRIASMKD